MVVRAHEGLPAPEIGRTTTRIDVVEQGTLSAAQALVTEGYNAVALNFASAKNPGGGFLNGAEAQEENLTRNSALFSALTAPQVATQYTERRALLKGGDGLYTDDLVYSPEVPVFRSEAGELLATPWQVAFISAAAPNAGVARNHKVPEKVIVATFAARAERVLSLAAANGHDALVLGAWGCGVFQNVPSSVAKIFSQLLGGKFSGVFARVTFAILGPEANRSPFSTVFSPSAALAPIVARRTGNGQVPQESDRRHHDRGRRSSRIQHDYISVSAMASKPAVPGAPAEASLPTTTACATTIAATTCAATCTVVHLAPPSGSPSLNPLFTPTCGEGSSKRQPVQSSSAANEALCALRAWASPQSGPTFELVDVGVNAHSLKQDWMARAAAAGVTRFLLTGCSLKGSTRGRELSEAASKATDAGVALRFTAGVHPHEASSWSDATAARIAQLAAHPACGAVGECGLDYDRMRSPRDVQMTAFGAQAALAVSLDKPLFLHCRELDTARGAPLGAYTDLLRVLNEAGAMATRCCVHCFTGSAYELRMLIAGGFIVGLTGFICKAERGAPLRTALRTLASEYGGAALLTQLVLETDAPYMRPPEGVLPKPAFSKGRDSEPAMTRAVCHTVAECLGVAPEAVAEATTKCAVALFWGSQ